MSLLTRAAAETYRPTSLRATAVVGLVAMSVVATGLLLLHVQLRFAISDLKIQTRKWQKDVDGLETRRASARSGLENLKAGERILLDATEIWGMVPYDPARAETLTVSTQRLEAWRQCKPGPAPAGRFSASRQAAGDDLKERGKKSIETILQSMKTRLAARPSSNP